VTPIHLTRGSVIIPAHNEASVIERTLTHLAGAAKEGSFIRYETGTFALNHLVSIGLKDSREPDPD
jgi:hypothetical protein